MAEQVIDVVIPVAKRPEAAVAVFSILATAVNVGSIFIVDGLPDGREGELIAELARDHGKVVPLRASSGTFNRAKCINAGLLASQSDMVLVSDGDIIWSTAALESLAAAIDGDDDTLCYLSHVGETDPRSRALKRPGYTFEVRREPDGVHVLIVRRAPAVGSRPGSGLVLARRSTWKRVGGYNEELFGWGWEDQDLLIRSALLGVRVTSAGQAIHLSHGDDKRNALTGRLDPVNTRDANIIASSNRINSGFLRGHLAKDDQPSAVGPKVRFDEGILRELTGRCN